MLELNVIKFYTKKKKLKNGHSPSSRYPYWPPSGKKRVFSPRSNRIFPNSPKCLRIGPGTIKSYKKFIGHTWTTMMLCTLPTVMLTFLCRDRRRPVTVPSPSRHRPVPVLSNTVPLASLLRPKAFSVPKRPSASLSVTKRPSASLSVP